MCRNKRGGGGGLDPPPLDIDLTRTDRIVLVPVLGQHRLTGGSRIKFFFFFFFWGGGGFLVWFEWGFYALSASKAIFRARTYNCITYSVR